MAAQARLSGVLVAGPEVVEGDQLGGKATDGNAGIVAATAGIDGGDSEIACAGLFRWTFERQYAPDAAERDARL